MKYVSFTEANGDLLELSLALMASGFQEATCQIGIPISPPGHDIDRRPDIVPFACLMTITRSRNK